MAGPLFAALLAEFDDEFTRADPRPIDAFAAERGNDKVSLTGMWSVDEPIVRTSKKSSKKKTKKRA
jgi:hypothetical protein